MFFKRRKYADYSNHKEIYGSEYKKIDIEDDTYFGAACLIEVTKEGEQKWAVRKNGERDIILDVGYKWLTLFPREEDFVIIAIYDVNSELVQIVFDIGKNISYKGKIPYYDDLYLDIIMTNDEIEFSGEIELADAYKLNTLKKADYQLARKAADRIVNKFRSEADFEYLKKVSDKYLNELKNLQD